MRFAQHVKIKTLNTVSEVIFRIADSPTTISPFTSCIDFLMDITWKQEPSE